MKNSNKLLLIFALISAILVVVAGAVFGILKAGAYSLVMPPTRGKGQDWVLILDAMKA